MRAIPILLLLVACYSPDTANCTVTCASANECGNGQVCGADGFCAEPSVAGHCAMMGSGSPEAPDAALPPANVALRITIAGIGRVTIQGMPPCDSQGPTQGDCTVMVPPHVSRALSAVETDKPFAGWTTSNCVGQGMTCTVTPTTALLVGAKFGGGGGE